MIVSLRKFLFLVLMTLALLAGTLGLSVRAITAPPTHLHHASVQAHGQLARVAPRIICPPPPYNC